MITLPSGKYKTNLKLVYLAKRYFDDEVKKYCYMWRDGGQFSTEKYGISNINLEKKKLFN